MDPRIFGVEDLLCDESFLRYCRGEDQGDALRWEEWIRNNPGKQPIVSRAKRLFDVLNLGQGNRIEQLASLKDAIERHSRFRIEVFGVAPSVSRSRVVRFGKNSLKYAASMILVVALGVFAYVKYRSPAKLYAYEYTTPAYGHKTVMLPDSSIVMLNENSHLSIARDFDARHRQVTITGEAFFDVRRDPGHPFLVNTAQYQIRVLGTSFNVRSYPQKGETETTLLTGRIEIVQNENKGRTEMVALQPNQKFVFSPGMAGVGRKKITTPVVDTATHRLAETSWARRKMEIEDKTFEDIARELQAWYGIKIRFADAAVKSYRYTATFDDETIFRALTYLQQSYPFAYTVEDDCIVIARN